MSLQDESFPADEFFDDFTFSRKQHVKNDTQQQQQHEKADIIEASPTQTGEESNAKELSENSNQSVNSLNVKSCANNSELKLGNKLDERPPKKNASNSNRRSYQNVHSEYTKHRFKHVASKVGQYIAKIKEEEKNRRHHSNSCSSFQRHRSMPETLTPEALPRDMNGSSHYSANELHKINDSSNSEVDPDTSGSIPSRHPLECCNEIDEIAYNRLRYEKEQIQSYSEYLQARLDEKKMENVTLKRNMDVMRFELSDLKDKIKRNSNISLTGSCGALTRQTNSFHIPAPLANNSKMTQTELATPLPRAARRVIGGYLSATPNITNEDDTTIYLGSGDDINLGVVGVKVSTCTKKVPKIQPLSLNFSNESAEVDSNAVALLSQDKMTSHALHPNSANHVNGATNHSGSSHPSSNDSAIEMEAIERRHHKSTTLLLSQTKHNNINTCSLNQQVHRDQDTITLPPRDGFYFYEKQNKRYISLEDINMVTLNSSGGGVNESTTNDSGTTNETDNTFRDSGIVRLKRKRKLRHRILRIFGTCGGCDDPNLSLEIRDGTYAEVPLLERHHAQQRS